MSGHIHVPEPHNFWCPPRVGLELVTKKIPGTIDNRTRVTESQDRVDRTASYSGIPVFKSRPTYRLYRTEESHGFPQSLEANVETVS
jgi:hypothetical protein